jgi:hypothetical protein
MDTCLWAGNFGELDLLDVLSSLTLFFHHFNRVALSDKRENTRPWNDQSNPGIQVHISFCSFFDIAEEEQRKNILRPTESFIRRTLVDQGNFIDVTIKEYQIHDVSRIFAVLYTFSVLILL